MPTIFKHVNKQGTFTSSGKEKTIIKKELHLCDVVTPVVDGHQHAIIHNRTSTPSLVRGGIFSFLFTRSSGVFSLSCLFASLDAIFF